MKSTLALHALLTLCEAWLAEVEKLPSGQLSSNEADRLVLACLLLAHDNAEFLGGAPAEQLAASLAVARSSDFAELDEIPWLLAQECVANREPGPTRRRVERLLGHENSNIRGWFHDVAWLIRESLDVDFVRPIQLANLADKLGGVYESAGLLAALHPDKKTLDVAADAFEPETFETQYRSRLTQIREREWNAYPLNLWVMEVKCRQVIWESVSSLEIRGEK